MKTTWHSLIALVIIPLIASMVIGCSCPSTISEPTIKEIPWTGEGSPPPPSPGTKWIITEETTPEDKIYGQLEPSGLLILADHLEKKEPYVQRFIHFMTSEILERRIIGIEDGKLLYIEEMPGGLKTECRYPLESLKVIAQYYRDSVDAGGIPVGKTYIINGKEVENPLQECIDIGVCVLINPYSP